MQKVEDICKESARMVGTSQVNESLQKMVQRHSPQVMKQYSKRLKFYYGTQVTQSPPTLVIMCNVADDIQTSYKRYMLKSFRKDLGFDNVPVRMFFRGKKETREKKERVSKA